MSGKRTIKSLPSDWSHAVDKASGDCYFYNKKTRESQWEAPKGTVFEDGLDDPGLTPEDRKKVIDERMKEACRAGDAVRKSRPNPAAAPLAC